MTLDPIPTESAGPLAGKLLGISSAERRQLLVEWNDTRVDDPDGECLHTLFEQQVERSQNAVALVFEDQQLTYRELNQRANQLAHHLRHLGVKPETLVGICVERSLEMVVGLLAILKAGGAYVPLDPDYPSQRLAFLLEDAAPALVLTQQHLRSRLPEHEIPVLCLDVQAEAWQRQPDTNPAPQASPDNLAYVIYTSGSTGQPKGVMITHRSVISLFAATQPRFSFHGGDVWTLFHSYSFDFSVWEIWGAILYGGRLVVVPYDVSRSPEEFYRLLAEHRVTILNQTPSAFMQLLRLDEMAPASQLRIRAVVFGGEGLDIPALRPWIERHGDEEPVLINMYGITETTVHVTFRQLRAADLENRSSVIGVPIPGWRVYVLDQEGQPVPTGMAGELYVGGVGLARGYLNRPELTAEKFVPDPFGDPGGRLYRTGDLVRWRADGNLEFLGRLDHQVKIRGFRIELGEIEAALAQCPGVAQNAVLAREDRPGDKRLVAYLVSKPGVELSAAALRAVLQERLPEHMVPSAFVILPSFPLTPNGKLDRKALPAPSGPNSELARAYVAPRDLTEQLLAAIWQELLGLDRVGIHDNFFELGGHSLLATRLGVRIRSAFKVELPLRALFEDPSIERLARRLQAQTQSHRVPLLPVDPRPRPEPLPLSFGQQRLWFLDQLEPGSLYNISVRLHLRGPLQIEALRLALEQITQRHEVLRTNFPAPNGSPRQHIAAAATCTLPRDDFSALPAAARQAKCEQEARSEALASFDLAAGPLWRARLLRLDEQQHVLLLTWHHSIFDGWSAGLFAAELAEGYTACLERRPGRLSALPVQYADFTLWQREWLLGAALEQQLAYWQQQLAGLAPLELPTDRPRPPQQSYRGAALPVRLSPELTAQLRSMAQRENATLFMAVLAGWQTLLARYSGQTDVAVGVPIAGRTEQALEGLLGFFVNTLVLRARLDDTLTVAGLLAQVRQTALEAYDHQEVPFELLVERLQPERDVSRGPLFQVALAWQNTSAQKFTLSGLEVEVLSTETETAKFELTLFLAEDDGGGLAGSLEYNSDLFDRSSVERLIGNLQVVLEGMAAQPQARLAELPLLTAQERRQLLVEWNDTRVDYPDGECLHTLFEQQVERSQNAVALVFEDQQLTYRELNQRANQLAHHLRHLGVKPETLVGICVERSLEMVVGLLAILKAGGAYVPLDPDYPSQRLAFLLEDAAPALVLTQQHLRSRLPEHEIPVLCLDVQAEAWQRQPDTNPLLIATPINAAYVIYTSGSTGNPKGAINTHRGIVNRLRWMQDAYGLDTSDGVLQKTTFSFDVSVWEFFWPLMAGAPLVLAVPRGQQDADYLANLIAKRRLTTAHFVPSMLQAFLQNPDLERCRSLRRVICSGEALPAELAREFARNLPWCELHNLYGPTEAAVDVTYFQYHPAFERTTTVPIGRPLSNTTVYVLDRESQPVPVGVAGELYLGGVGLARGYLNRPELTAEKFVPDPFGDPGGRLYRTGDLVRWRADGNLEFLGRLDHQVKIRGFRIELGEIEAALAQCPGVAQNAVLAREDRPGDKRLVAYLVSKPGVELSAAALRAVLQERLPEHMVPSAFVILPSFPLTPNGKLDRKALPAPSGPNSELARAYVAPRDLTEQLLAAIWQELLGLDRVGIHDNFFELGGHSLLATRLGVRIRSAFKVELPLRALFEDPSIERLARRLQAQTQSHRVPLLPVDPRPRPEPLPLSFGQQRLWFLDQLEPGSLYNISVRLHLRGPLQIEALRLALEQITQRHEVLRTNFPAPNGSPRQHIAAAATCTLPRDDFSALPAAARQAKCEQEARSEALASFDLAAGPLWRARLLRLDEQQHVLLLTWHHSIFDGWSAGLFAAELAEGYTACLERRPGRLSALPVQYADFTLWQREWLLGAALEQQLAYWQQQLAGLAPLELPTDRPRPPQQSYRGAALPVRLSPELTAQLRSMAQRENATLFMAVLAGWQTLLARYSGQTDVAVGVPIAGRTEQALEGLLGFFVNTLVLRARLDDTLTVAGLLAQVRQTALEAYDHQEVPFELLVERLQPERDVSRGPLFQVALAWQNTSAQKFTLSGLEVEVLSTETETAKFELTLFLAEDDGGGLAGSLEYNSDLFDRSSVERLIGNLQVVLEGMAAQPQARLAELPLLTAQERRQLLVEWNDTRVDYPDGECLHTLFEQQVEQTPDAVALVFEDQQLTYRELNQRANQLAHHLRHLGVKPETLVGICVERSLEMVVGLLAILKAGGAYVPLDPSYPPDRLAFMLQDCGLRLVLCLESLVGSIPAEGIEICCLDGDREQFADGSEQNPESTVGAENLAYVMYTSGSTGRPKGVSVVHRGVVRLVKNANYAELNSGTVVLQFAPLTFDASTFEIWAPLLNGGRLVVFRPGLAALAELGALVRDREINTLWLTAALFHELVNDDLDCFRGLRQLLVGGDVVSPRQAVEALRRLTPCHLINGYGPTESTTFACCYPMTSPEQVGASTPIGRPISNTQVYVLDDQRQLAPVGAAGELYIGGDGLARGYWNRPDLTAEKFIANPFDSDPRSRLYKTGDLVRWLPDGNLDFIGRIDQQVKIRGFRIEPEEIEAALLRYPDVRAAVVVAQEGVPGGKRLVAYWVAHEGSAAREDTGRANADLLRHLRAHLPEYMIPSALWRLDRLPLTPNGKVDSRALPILAEPRPDLEASFVSPRTPVEKMVAGLWQELLRVERVGIHDNFFSLGGHSLLAVQLVARLQKLIGKPVPLAAIFRAQTIASLVETIAVDAANPFDLIQTIQATGRKIPVVWFGHLAPLHQLKRADHPLIWVEMEGMDGRPPQHDTIAGMGSYYAQRLAGLIGSQGAVLAGFSLGGLVAFETARQLNATQRLPISLFLIEPSPPGKTIGARRTPPIHMAERVRGNRRSKLAYVREKAISYSRWIVNGVTRHHCRRLLKAGLPVPFHLRWRHFEPLYLRAIRAFEPGPFAGRLTLVIGAQEASGANDHWSASVAKNRQLVTIAAESHLALVENPDCVSQWLPLLQQHLQSCEETPVENSGADRAGRQPAQFVQIQQIDLG